VLDGQRGQVSVVGEVAGRPQRSQQAAQDGSVPRGGVDDRRARLGEPPIDDVEHVFRPVWPGEYGGPGGEPYDGKQNLPGEPDRLGAGKGVVQTAPGAGVPGAVESSA